MNDPKSLFDLAHDLRSLADSVLAVAETMTSTETAATTQPEMSVPAKEPDPKIKPITLEQVRAVLADKSQQGLTAEVRILLEKYGAPKLSQIDPANYAALLADAENLK